MGSFNDLTGKKFGRLTAIYYQKHQTKTGRFRSKWLWQCDCGKTTLVETYKVTSGHTSSCGCLLKEVISRTAAEGKFHKHMLARTKEYKSWESMLRRCNNPTDKRYHNYGGRGIKVCERWYSVENFYTDMGKRPAGTTLGRIDNDKGYSPENCRWETQAQQQNNKSTNTTLTLNGEIKNLGQWAKSLGIHPTTLSTRLRDGWSVEKALTQPVRKRKNKITCKQANYRRCSPSAIKP